MNVTLKQATTARQGYTVATQDRNFLKLANPIPLEHGWESSTQPLVYWAEHSPQALYLAERTSDESWRKVSYAEAEAQTRILARKLIKLGCSSDRPLVIIAANSIDHALLSLAAQRIGVAVAPISLAYASAASDFSRLRSMIELVEPGAIFVGDPASCQAAITNITDLAPIVIQSNSDEPNTVTLATLGCASEEAFDHAESLVGPDTIAKLLFTSGSTGKPKAVINTQRMQCTNQAMLRQVWPALRGVPPVMVDWLPWSHTFGGNFAFNMSLFNGGALYIDAGKPVPALIGTTLRNLAEIKPNIYFNVPAGYEAILNALRGDDELCASIFSRMEFAFCAAAALPQSVRDELQSISQRITGRRLPFLAGWGSTETAPCVTATWWDTERSDCIGLPLPGVELRFAADGDKQELRVRGPNVTPGYWRNPEATRDAFDQDGYYKMGDAGKLIDADAPYLGVLFDGRVSENFKLTSGTWVTVGSVRVGVVDEGRPIIQDVVVTGSGCAEIGLLVFVNHAACKAIIGSAGDALDPAEVAGHPEVRTAIASALRRYNKAGRGSSSRIARFLVLPDTPNLEAFEITDKGYINQRAVLKNRTRAIDALYADEGNKLG